MAWIPQSSEIAMGLWLTRESLLLNCLEFCSELLLFCFCAKPSQWKAVYGRESLRWLLLLPEGQESVMAGEVWLEVAGKVAWTGSWELASPNACRKPRVWTGRGVKLWILQVPPLQWCTSSPKVGDRRDRKSHIGRIYGYPWWPQFSR